VEVNFGSCLFFQAENICYSVLCVFSYVAAGHEQKKAISSRGALTPTSTGGVEILRNKTF